MKLSTKSHHSPFGAADLTKICDQELLSRLERLTKSERKITHLILWHLLEMEERRLYLKLNYDSLYKYLTQHLGYSESAAYDRIQAMRVLKKAPSIAAKTLLKPRKSLPVNSIKHLPLIRKFAPSLTTL